MVYSGSMTNAPLNPRDQVDSPEQGRPPRAPMVLIGVLALMLGAVVGLGGLKERTYQRIDLDPGVVVCLNHAEVRILSASVRQPSMEGGYAEFRVLAEVRNLSDQPLTSDAFGRSIKFGYANDKGELDESSWVRMVLRTARDSTETSPRGYLVPGGGFMPVTFIASVQNTVDAHAGLRMVLHPQEWGVPSVFGMSTTKEWMSIPSGQFWFLALPLSEED